MLHIINIKLIYHPCYNIYNQHTIKPPSLVVHNFFFWFLFDSLYILRPCAFHTPSLYQVLLVWFYIFFFYKVLKYLVLMLIRDLSLILSLKHFYTLFPNASSYSIIFFKTCQLLFKNIRHIIKSFHINFIILSITFKLVLLSSTIYYYFYI